MAILQQKSLNGAARLSGIKSQHIELRDALFALPKCKQQATGDYQAQCPAHEDDRPSLSFKIDQDRILLHCHATCSTQAVVQALGFKSQDLFAATEQWTRQPRTEPKPEIPDPVKLVNGNATEGMTQEELERVSTSGKYEARYMHGENHCVLRTPSKKFLQLHKTGNRWHWNAGKNRPPYFGKPENPKQDYLIVEGQKAVNAVADKFPDLNVLTGGNCSDLESLAKHPFPSKSIIYAYSDHDRPGREGMKLLADLLAATHEPARLHFQLNDGESKKGLDDCLDRATGADAATTLLDELLNSIEENRYVPEPITEPLANPLADTVVEDQGEVELTCAADIEPEHTNWILQDWIAQRQLHILAGPPGKGKTTISMQIASRVSKGTDFIGVPCEKGQVAIWTGEDVISQTLVPRLVACKANLKNIHFISGFTDKTGKRDFDIANDIVPLCETLKKIKNLKLLILDPIVGITGNSRDAYKATEVRKCLEPLLHLIRETNAAVIGITHFSKAQSSGNAGSLDRVIGSQAWGAVARIVMCCDYSKEKDSNVLAMVKNNLAVGDSGFRYQLQEIETGSKKFKTTLATFNLERIEQSADAIFKNNSEETKPDSEIDIAKDILKTIIDDQSLAWADIVKQGRKEGCSEASLRRARNDMKSEKTIFSIQKGRQVWWMLTQPE